MEVYKPTSQIVCGSPRHQVAKQIEKELNELGLPEIKEVVLDDWSDYGDFWLYVCLNLGKWSYPESKNFSLRRITYAIKRVVQKHGARLNFIEHPKRRYNVLGTFVGYDGDFSVFSIYVPDE